MKAAGRIWGTIFAVVLIVLSLPPETAHASTEEKTEYTEQSKNLNQAAEQKALYGTVENCNFTDFENWKSGIYSWIDGMYMEYPQRICLSGYKTFEESSFTVSISDSAYRFLIRELDSDMNFQGTVILSDGEVYEPSPDAVYLGIGIYKTYSENRLSCQEFEKMFADGFSADLKEMEHSAETVYDSFQDELKAMLESGDMSTHDVSKYQMSYSKMYSTYTQLIQGECYLAYQSGQDVEIESVKDQSGMIQSVRLNNADCEFSERYRLVREAVDEALALVKPEMSDVEKALVLHDYLVERTSYGDGTGAHSASNPLAYGWGVCDGYAGALEVLLHEAGIESNTVWSKKMNHSWVMARLGGEWYHIDPTWDDSRSRESGKTDHTFFMRNDVEFENSSCNKHYGWVSYEFDPVSTAVIYEGWFVHDLTGKILYQDGWWYYAAGNQLMCSGIDGSGTKVLDKGSLTMELVSLDSENVSYKSDGVIKSRKL